MTREEKEQTGKYVLQMARLLEDGCYQQEMLLKAVYIIDEALEQESVLDKVREEIDKIYEREGNSVDCLNALDELKWFIDKYKAEVEPQEVRDKE